MASIKELLEELQQGAEENRSKLPNTKETWRRIANKDSFDELGLSQSELTNFLSEWISDNPYSNI